MRFVTGVPDRWTVELLSGELVEIWADAVQREGDYWTFTSCVDLDHGEELPPADAMVDGERPSNAGRLFVVVARFPTASVRVPDGEDWPASHNG